MSFISRFIYSVNSYCNLHCELCSELSNKPPRIWETPLEEVALFCKRFDNIALDKYVHLTGGEPTAVPDQVFEKMVDMFHRHGRKLILVTNGYNVLGINKGTLNKIDMIKLDDHGINHHHIMDCITHLKTFYTGRIQPIETLHHYDLGATRKLKVNKGKRCDRETLRSRIEVVIKQGVVYPCCAMASFDLYEDDHKMEHSLMEKGWVLSNKNLLETTSNWKTTLPKHVLDQCDSGCWWPHKQILGAVPITLKPNDVIRKPQTEPRAS